ncbi:MAG: SDR family NAD(P)-dependent oxidoreductase [Steroidobacteraceae bacterium]|jgi:dehydrogenase/reductase SDR family protein 12|nr:SDR family NAD(P)-dependent oxidoreductase [Steroidobacteraceae bacterium]
MDWQQLGRALAFYGRFAASFTQPGYRTRRLRWPRLAPDFRGQRWLVTGGSGGLGAWIATEAARAGARVTVAARSASKLETLRSAARAAGIDGIDAETCDFSLQADTARLLGRLRDAGRPLDVLVNNVGVLEDELRVTTEGREATFVSNLLSHYQLTEGLVRHGLLRQPGGLVINMSSGGAYFVPLAIAALDVTDPARFDGTTAYALHKRAQLVLNRYWRDTYGPRGLDFYVMHPGWVDTPGVQRSLPRFRALLRPLLRDAASGGDTALWLAATRPPQALPDGLWFDRALRPAHVHERTSAGAPAPPALVAYLEQALDRLPGSRY